MKKLILHFLCATILAAFASITPAVRADCTPISTAAPDATFGGQICIDPSNQSIYLDGAITTSGRVARVEATGTITRERVDGQSTYTISGPVTLTGVSAGENPVIIVSACGDSLNLAATRFITKIISLKLP